VRASAATRKSVWRQSNDEHERNPMVAQVHICEQAGRPRAIEYAGPSAGDYSDNHKLFEMVDESAFQEPI
jgi:hypothetical protein